MNHRIAKALTTVGIIAFIYSGSDLFPHYSPSFPSNRLGMVQCQRAHDLLIATTEINADVHVNECVDYSRPVPCVIAGQHSCGPIFNPSDAQ